jgi:hypothetical protein
MIDEEVVRLVNYLGLSLEEGERYLAMARRSKDSADLARSLLRKKIRQVGGDPDDLAAFPLIHALPTGSIAVGRVINGKSEGPVFAVPAGFPGSLQHMLLASETRYGKSRAAFSIIAQHIQAGGNCWVFDFEHEYHPLVSAIRGKRQPVPMRASDLRINFLQPPHDLIDWRIWWPHLGMVVRGDFFLRDGSMNLLDTGIGVLMRRKNIASGSGNYPSLYELYRYFANLKFSGGSVRGNQWLESVNNRLRMLVTAFPHTAHTTHSDMLPKLAERPVIFRMREIDGVPRQFLVDFLLMWLARYKETIS